MDELSGEKKEKRTQNLSQKDISFDNKNTPPPTLILSEVNQSVIGRITDNGLGTKYPIFVFICLYTSLMADGVEMTLMNLLIIPMRTYFNLSSFQIQAVAATLFLGVAIGSLTSGWLSRSIGRVAILKASLFMLIISHLLMAASQNVGMFVCFRMIIGYLIGIIVPISLNLYSEYLPAKYRGFFILFSWFFLGLGLLFSGIIIYCQMPNLEISKMKTVLMIQTVFSIIAFLWNCFFLHDSPRNLIINNNKEKAFDILKSMNKGIELSREEKKAVVEEILSQANITIEGNISDLFSKQYLMTTILCIFLFLVHAGSFAGVYVISTLTEQELSIEQEEVNNTKIIKTQIITAFVSLFAYILGGILTDIKVFGRKGVLAVWIFVNGVMMLPSVYFPKLFTLFFSIAMFSTHIWGNVLVTYIIEIYPTKLRDISTGFLLMTLRIFSFFAQFLYLGLLEIHYKIPYYLTTVLLLLGVIATIILPFESVKKPLDIQYEEEKDGFIKGNFLKEDNEKTS